MALQLQPVQCLMIPCMEEHSCLQWRRSSGSERYTFNNSTMLGSCGGGHCVQATAIMRCQKYVSGRQQLALIGLANDNLLC